MRVDIPLTNMSRVSAANLEPGTCFLVADGNATRVVAIKLDLNDLALAGYLTLEVDEPYHFRVLRGADIQKMCIKLPLGPLHIRLGEGASPRDRLSLGNLLVGDADAWVVAQQFTGMGDYRWVYVSFRQWTVTYDLPDGAAAFDSWEMVHGSGDTAATVIRKSPPGA